MTRIGKYLRKYKLRTSPTLQRAAWTMSLIGPRPKLPHLEAMPMPFRPGLTGAATLAFRREEEMLKDVPDDDLEAYYCRLIKPLKAKIDWDYMRKATFASDFALLYETARYFVSTRANSREVDFSESAQRTTWALEIAGPSTALPRISCRGWWCRRPAPEALTCSGCFSSTLPQTRHPERRAAQIGHVRQGFMREVEGPRRTDATHAARSFSTTETRKQDLLQYALDGHGSISLMHYAVRLGRKAPSSTG